jgi:hypothetical protein
MNNIMKVIALSGAIVVGTRALASDPVHQSTMNKRQMFAQIVDCMKKRMAANKSSSYNETLKACKDRIKESGSLQSGALVASDTPAQR